MTMVKYVFGHDFICWNMPVDFSLALEAFSTAYLTGIRSDRQGRRDGKDRECVEMTSCVVVGSQWSKLKPPMSLILMRRYRLNGRHTKRSSSSWDLDDSGIIFGSKRRSKPFSVLILFLSYRTAEVQCQINKATPENSEGGSGVSSEISPRFPMSMVLPQVAADLECDSGAL